jgi:competence ComEA-like helix-hairpin-helix protein
VRTTRQERLALGVVALLLAAGVGARAVRGSPSPAAWEGAGATVSAEALTAEVADSLARVRHRRTPLAPGEVLDLNTATVDDLVRLPRVGPALAGRIVARRETHGPYRTLADLDSVAGVGPALLAQVAPLVGLPEPAPRAEAPPAAPARATPSLAASGGGRVDVNTAGAAELERLPGIGPALAQRIVEWRAANGPFRAVDDLQRVPGIGAAKLERLRPVVSVYP